MVTGRFVIALASLSVAAAGVAAGRRAAAVEQGCRHEGARAGLD
jgi:hypothetical protein